MNKVELNWIETGGAGGSGTVFWRESGSAGVGELRLDNRGQDPEVKATGAGIDLTTTGQ
jgi:hypothetical protein